MRQALVLAALLLLPSGATLRQEGPVAVVVSLSGPVQLRMGDEEPRAATVGTRLTVGDQVLPGPGAAAVLVFSSGATRTLSDATTIVVPGGETAGDMFTRTVQVLSQAASSDARTQPNRQGMIRPIPGTPEIISPRNGIPVRGVRPTFTWHPSDETTQYMIQIRKEGSPPVRYEVGAATSWTLPPDAPPLSPGEDYRWTVGPKGPGRVSREMEFQVLSVEAHDTLNERLGILLGAGLDPEGDGGFLAAVIYREAGLYYDAAEALGFLEDAGQNLGVEALLLKGEVMDAMGDLEAAQAAFDQADRMGR